MVSIAPRTHAWDELAEFDPFWAVLTKPGHKGGHWRLHDFLATGEIEVARVLQVARRLGLPRRSSRALDFGCGVGRITRALSGHFAECTGIDVSKRMVDHARKINVDRPRCRFRADADLALLEPESFDLVWSVLVLQHLRREEIRRSLVHLLRVLRPDGLLVFQLPYALSPLHRLQLSRRAYGGLRRLGLPSRVLIEHTPLTPMRMTAIGGAEIARLLAAAGGVVQLVEPYEGEEANALYYVARRGAIEPSTERTDDVASGYALTL